MFYIDGKPLSEIKDIEIETIDAESPEAKAFVFNNDKAVEFEVMGDINIEILTKNLTEPDPRFTLEFPIIKQIRKHKKRRINKKWLKRYGIKKESIKIDNMTIRTESDGTFIITKDNEKGEKYESCRRIIETNKRKS